MERKILQDYSLLADYAAGEKVYGEESESVVKIHNNYAIKLTKKTNIYYEIIEEYKKIDFPNVLKIESILDMGNCFYTKMENLQVIKPVFESFLEALHFLRDCTKGLADLQKIQISHNDIKIHNIMKTEAGVFKIIDLDYIRVDKTNENCDFNNYSSSFYAGTKGFLSPERIIQRERNETSTPFTVNAYKCDVYSLGISFLSLLKHTTNAASLVLPATNDVIQSAIDSLPDPYSKFKEIIKKMVKIDSDFRPDPLDLYNQINNTFELVESLTASCFNCEARNLPEKDLILIEKRGVSCRPCLDTVYFKFEP